MQGIKDYRLLSSIITNNHYKLLAFTGLEETPAYEIFLNSLNPDADLVISDFNFELVAECP